MDFGRGPLSHPLLVDAIEERFVPLAIHNNKPGPDKVVLDRYEEPEWNNPVVRFFASSGDELIERKDRVWSAVGLADRMTLALAAAEHDVPGYLDIAREELATAELERVVVSMFCYWKGEALYGGRRGVRATRAGWLDGREVVEVAFDPAAISLRDLLATGRANSCADRVWVAGAAQEAAARGVLGDEVRVIERGAEAVARDAEVSDRKYYLRRSPANYLPLTPLQATRANSALAPSSAGGLAGGLAAVLSKRQLDSLKRIEARLAEDATALDGLVRPAAVEALVDYAQELERRLVRR